MGKSFRVGHSSVIHSLNAELPKERDPPGKAKFSGFGKSKCRLERKNEWMKSIFKYVSTIFKWIYSYSKSIKNTMFDYLGIFRSTQNEISWNMNLSKFHLVEPRLKIFNFSFSVNFFKKYMQFPPELKSLIRKMEGCVSRSQSHVI